MHNTRPAIDYILSPKTLPEIGLMDEINVNDVDQNRNC